MTFLTTPTRTLLASLAERTHLPVLSTVAVRMAYLFMQWDARQRERWELRHMPDHYLRDIGLNRRQASLEAKKPFWRP